MRTTKRLPEAFAFGLIFFAIGLALGDWRMAVVCFAAGASVVLMDKRHGRRRRA